MRKFFYLFFKRVFDIVVSLIFIAVLLVPMILIALVVRLTSRGRAIFKQKRVGKNKKLFTIYKFRSMARSTPDIPTRDFDNSISYVTKVGKFLRKTSLDELPQLFNILFGNMSFVGPRPPLFNEYDQIEARDAVGVNVLKPGLTGWAQVNGRNVIDIETKTAYDAEYLKRASFWFDLKIMFMTFFQVLRGKDIEIGKPAKVTAHEANDDIKAKTAENLGEEIAEATTAVSSAETAEMVQSVQTTADRQTVEEAELQHGIWDEPAAAEQSAEEIDSKEQREAKDIL